MMEIHAWLNADRYCKEPVDLDTTVMFFQGFNTMQYLMGHPECLGRIISAVNSAKLEPAIEPETEKEFPNVYYVKLFRHLTTPFVSKDCNIVSSQEK